MPHSVVAFRSPVSLARPKSAILTTGGGGGPLAGGGGDLTIRMFAGLRSRWTIPCGGGGRGVGGGSAGGGRGEEGGRGRGGAPAVEVVEGAE